MLGPIVKMVMPMIKLMGPEKIGNAVEDFTKSLLNPSQFKLKDNEIKIAFMIYERNDEIYGIPVFLDHEDDIKRFGEAIKLKNKIIDSIKNL